MRRHVAKGVAIIDAIIEGFDPDFISHLGIARNIIAFHHENVDGSGYPLGVRGSDIPIEARIVAVADVFDALTSDRPYKRQWSNEKALDEVRKLIGRKFDRDCAEALVRRMDDVVKIQERFRGDRDA
jgi:HD-GYP domain-containing protein (c-di-GMP phosphodiesterase class II)